MTDLVSFIDGKLRSGDGNAGGSALFPLGAIGARQFCYSGRKLVLRNTEGTVLFVWMYPDEDKRMDDQIGYNCAMFRNESERRSSDIIRGAEYHAVAKWGL